MPPSAREIQIVDVEQGRSILQPDARFGLDQQAFGRPPVDHFDYAVVGEHLGGGRERAVQSEFLLAVQHLRNVQADVVDQVVASHGHRLAGDRAQGAAPLVDEVQLARIERVASHAHGHGVEHGVAFGVGVGGVAGALRHQEVVGNGRHGRR